MIDRTSRPLWFYGFNNEGGKTDRRTTDVEITGAAGVVMLGHKREGGAPMLSLRAGDDPAVIGVVLSGQGTRTVLVRAVGPCLAALGVAGGVPDPAVRLYRGQTAVLENEDWDAPGATASAGVFAAAGAFALPAASRDAALVATLAPGDYSVHASARPGTGGTLVLEVFDLRGDDTAQVTNLSLLGRLRADAENPIVGFVVSGAAGPAVLLRAVGPSLSAFGVGDAVRDPMMQVFAGSQAVDGNDNWGASGDAGGLVRAMAAAGAFPLAAGSLDAVVSSTLAPGASAQDEERAHECPGQSGLTRSREEREGGRIASRLRAFA